MNDACEAYPFQECLPRFHRRNAPVEKTLLAGARRGTRAYLGCVVVIARAPTNLSRRSRRV